MRYKNKKTGAIIDTPCIINGGEWVPHVEKNKKTNYIKSQVKTDF